MKLPDLRPGIVPMDVIIVALVGLITTLISVASLTTWAYTGSAMAISVIVIGILRKKRSAAAAKIEDGTHQDTDPKA